MHTPASRHFFLFACSMHLLLVLPLAFGQEGRRQQPNQRTGRAGGRAGAGPEAALTAIFASVDKDKDGKATMEDFASNRFFRKAMFDAIDADANGTITREEINVAARVDSPTPDPKRVKFEGREWVADLAYGAKVVEYKGKQALHIVGREQTFVYLPIDDFSDGTIEVDVAGDIFSGIGFRGRESGRRAEKVYFRPQNAHTDRHENSVQYSVIGREDGHWSYLRRNHPGKYETGADIKQGEWFHVRLDIQGKTLKVFVNDSAEPLLTVDPVLDGDTRGSVGVWGWDSYFTNFRYTPSG